jgi:hypothetical protein
LPGRLPLEPLLLYPLQRMSEDRDHGRRGGPALERAYQFVLWVVPALDKFPRSQRFLLGDRIEAAALSSAAFASPEAQGKLWLTEVWPGEQIQRCEQ